MGAVSGSLPPAAHADLIVPVSQSAPDLFRMPERLRIDYLTQLSKAGYDLDEAVAATKDAVLRESVERDAGLAEIAAGHAVDAELRWRAMPTHRGWFRLGVALFIDARLKGDDELADEIRRQILITASDGLSRFDADIAGYMLGLTAQKADAEGLSPQARVLVARLENIERPDGKPRFSDQLVTGTVSGGIEAED